MNDDNMSSDNYEHFYSTITDPLVNQSILNSPLPSFTINSANTLGNYGTVNANGFGTYITNNTGGNLTTPNTLEVRGDANFEGDIKFKGKSLQELFSKIEDRLAILQPDPKKLEKYEALRKAYEHYKLLEKLVQED